MYMYMCIKLIQAELNSPLCQFTRDFLTFLIPDLVSLFLMMPLAGRGGGGGLPNTQENNFELPYSAYISRV